MAINLIKNKFEIASNNLNKESAPINNQKDSNSGLSSQLKNMISQINKLSKEKESLKKNIKIFEENNSRLESKLENKIQTILDYRDKIKELNKFIKIYEENEKIYLTNQAIYDKQILSLSQREKNMKIKQEKTEGKLILCQEKSNILSLKINSLEKELNRLKSLKWYEKILGKL